MFVFGFFHDVFITNCTKEDKNGKNYETKE